MKTITFFGSGREQEAVTNPTPEYASIIQALTKHYKHLKFGGTTIGYMGAFTQQAAKQHMHITAIITTYFKEHYEETIDDTHELIITETLSKRKELLLETDAIICYPGGLGTFDELFEVLARISLHELDNKPVYLYNHQQFFAPILLQLQHGLKSGLIHKQALDCLHTFSSVDELTQLLNTHA